MSRHGKQLLSGIEPEKTKSEESSVDALVDIAVETLQSITRTPGSPVPKFEWDAIAQKFRARTGLAFKKEALKNRWDQLRKDWTLWTRMTQNETGLDWDDNTRRAVMSDEWWDLKIKENKDYAKFRKHGFRWREQLEFCFARGVATGKYCVVPNSGHNPYYTSIQDDLAATDWFQESGDAAYIPITVEDDTMADPPEKSTASSPAKKDDNTPTSKKTAPRIAVGSPPFVPSSSGKSASSSRKRKSVHHNSASDGVTRIADIMQIHMDQYNARMSGKKDSTVDCHSVATQQAKPDPCMVILNEMLETGEIAEVEYLWAVTQVDTPMFARVFPTMVPRLRRAFIIQQRGAAPH